MAAEAILVGKIIDRVNRCKEDDRVYNAKAIKIHTGLYQEKGTPDILVSILTLFGVSVTMFIEVKAGSEVSAIQRVRLNQWAEAGMVTAIIEDDVADFDALLDHVLDDITLRGTNPARFYEVKNGIVGPSETVS